MGDRIDGNRSNTCASNSAAGRNQSTQKTSSNASTPVGRTDETPSEVSGYCSSREANDRMRKLTGEEGGQAVYTESIGWTKVERHLEDIDSLKHLTDRTIHQLAGFDGLHAGELRDVVGNRAEFWDNTARVLESSLGDKVGSREINEATDQIVEQATVAFGQRVSELIGERARDKLRGIEVGPHTVNESPKARRSFLQTLGERTGGNRHDVLVALAKLNVGGERADRIADAVEAAHERGELDELGTAGESGPDIITGWSDGQYQNAADDLQSALDDTLSSIESLRSQLGHRDMATPESANLVNPNVSATRRNVLDALEIGDISDVATSEAGGDAEIALKEYRRQLMTDDQWTEKAGSALEAVTYGIADYFSGGAASGGKAGMQLFVSWHEANMADFAERHADTADAGTGAQQWREVGELATETAVSVVTEQLLNGLPTPEEAPEHVDVVIEDVQSRAATRIGQSAGSYTGDRVSDVAGETTVEP